MTLTVTDLSVGRAGLAVLSGLNFRIEPGRALILRGPNGSGKTTLLRTLAGLTPPLTGRIELAPDSIAYAGHADGIKAQLSVAENLRFWAESFGHGEIGPALAAFDLEALADRRTAELSAGQKRRCSLARMMVTGRPVWCLDEPTVSLDSENVARFARAVTAHLAQGGCAVLATHIDLGFEAQTLDTNGYRPAPGQSQTDDPFAWESRA